MGPANVSGIVTGNPLVSYWPVPEVFSKVKVARLYFFRGIPPKFEP